MIGQVSSNYIPTINATIGQLNWVLLSQQDVIFMGISFYRQSQFIQQLHLWEHLAYVLQNPSRWQSSQNVVLAMADGICISGGLGLL